jgi:predicted transcriptional regulator
LRRFETVWDMSLSPIQIRAAQLLARGLTQQEVATQVGISRRTISRWLSTEEFRNLSFGLVGSSPKNEPEIQLKSHTDDGADYAIGDLVPMAIKTLVDILSNADTRVSDRLKAVSLVGEWAGLTSDFNVALASLRRYGLLLSESEDGTWILHNQREKQIFDE